MKYVCENPVCSEYGKEETLVAETFVLRGGRLVGKNSSCPVCGCTRREINPNASVGPTEKNVTLAKYSMASADGKREILKKRSHEHYEKEIRPVKEEKLRKAVESFKEASK